MRDYPKGVLRVYDNGGESIDRYTVYFWKRYQPANRAYYSCLAMNGTPFHPQGFGQHSEGLIGKHNGRLIDFKDLPPDCQKCVRQDLKAYEDTL